MTAPTPETSDQDHVLATLAGRQDRYVELIRRYQHLVFGLCRSMLGSTEDALDAAQDTFIIAYKRLHELRNQADFRAWLRGIATNACRQKLRARRTAANLAECQAWIDPYQRVDSEIDLNQALAKLSADTRLTVLLFYFEGSSVREIAQFLGVPETTVMSRLRNARSQLKRDLQPMFDVPTKNSSLPDDFADRIPIPYDEYGPAPRDHQNPLSPWRTEWLLSAFPAGSTVSTPEMIGHDWEAVVDRDVQITVQRPDGKPEPVVLRMSGRKDGIKVEAAILSLLANETLHVPRIVNGPSPDPEFRDRGMLLATTPPVGQSALAWAVDGGTKAIDQACEVVLEGIAWIAALTPKVESSPAAALLERCSLADELARIVKIGGPWTTDSQFSEAVKRLEPIVKEISVPLIFSDSGIGPNARVDETGNLVGFGTLAWARIEDPHYQITKYWTYDCWPIRRAGFVERYLVRNNLTMKDFAPRLAVRALATLQREIPVKGGEEGYRNDMLGWLKLAIEHL